MGTLTYKMAWFLDSLDFKLFLFVIGSATTRQDKKLRIFLVSLV